MTAPTATAVCSFCLKAASDVERLVAGPGVYICDECVGLCDALLRATPAGRNEPGRPAAPWEAEAGLDAVLASLPRVARSRDQADYALAQYLRRAEELGATPDDIGRALGVTSPPAPERVSGEE